MSRLRIGVWLAVGVVIAACRGREGDVMANEGDKTTGAATAEPRKVVIDSPIAGSWYSANADALRREVAGYIDHAVPPPEARDAGGIVGLVVPHAGYRYSGAIAGFGYRMLQGMDVRRVVVLGPSHQVRFGGLGLTEATHWRTPLGEYPIDTDAVKKLAGATPFLFREDAFRREHSVDIQVPFLQVVAPRAKLVPIIVGGCDATRLRDAGRAIRELAAEPGTIVVASSDFTHYGENYGYVPFRTDVEANLAKLADAAFGAIASMDPDTLAAKLDETDDTVCGQAPIRVLMTAVPARARAVRLAYDTSGRVTGDFANSVTYQSIAFGIPANYAFRNSEVLSVDEQRFLLALARETIKRHLAGKPLPDPEKEGQKIPDKLKQDFGVFVTLKKHGDLRGCIGSILPVEPLWEGVVRNAVNAATHDPRFPPMTLPEEREVELEVSVLTPPREVPGYDDIVLGRDGILLSKGGMRSVFLPQVAPEQGWDLQTTLEYLSRKAGLGGSAWRSGTRFQTFQAHVFGETEYQPGK